jgi:uncharacterized protein YndB with AHSA1/START domain
MDFDFERHFGAMTRTVAAFERDGQPARAVILSRAYDTSAADLWDAISNPERLPRWFLPVSGDLRLGGRYQLKGNAGGTITACEPPRHLALTWEFGGGVSWVDVRLADEANGTARLTLEHVAHVSDHWEKFGAGAVGVGWDLALVALGVLLGNPSLVFDEAALAGSAEGKAFIRSASDDWARASIEAGTPADAARAAAQATSAFYTGEGPAGG